VPVGFTTGIFFCFPEMKMHFFTFIEFTIKRRQLDMINVSNKAVEKIREILAEEEKKDWSLRIGVKGGGCSGFTYALNIAQGVGENDQVFDFDGVKVVVDSKSFTYLSGTELDFTDGLHGSGFVFNNPNASRTCGCGNSFGA